MKAVFRTDQGKVRTHNEDFVDIFYKQNPDMIFAIVADGMGGHRAGDVASEMTVSKLKQAWNENVLSDSAASLEAWLKDQITQVNSALYQHALENEECEGMGTTIVAVVCTDRFATIANIGDSRCYLLNEDGFKQVTEDHSLVNELVRNGQISREDAEHHPRKNVLLRALGTEQNVEMDIKTVVFEEGDFLLLCSDGLSNKITESEMEQILRKNDSIDAAADEFIQKANENGGEDNITLAILLHDLESERG